MVLLASSPSLHYTVAISAVVFRCPTQTYDNGACGLRDKSIFSIILSSKYQAEAMETNTSPMKKRVSWSTETLQRDRDIAEALAAVASKDDKELSSKKDIHVSSTTSANTTTASAPTNAKVAEPVTALQVNSRIQQMIAMQKAQNATMRQLMSTGYGGVGSASPSGLKDLLLLPSAGSAKKGPAPDSIQDTVIIEDVGNESPLTAKTSLLNTCSPTFQPIKPPAELKNNPTKFTAPNLSPEKVNAPKSDSANVGIRYQGQQKNNVFNMPPPPSPPPPPSQPVPPPRSFNSTPPNLHPVLPLGNRDDINDSPVSYNSVLDQNATPGTILERKRMQQQLQTIQSQIQMEGQNAIDGDVDRVTLTSKPGEHQSLRIEQFPQPRLNEDINWGNIAGTREYSLQPMESHRHKPTYQHHQPEPRSISEYGLSSVTVRPPQENTASVYQPQAHPQKTPHQLPQHQTTNNVVGNISPLHYPTSHTHHQFHYGGVGGPPASVSIQSTYDHAGGYGSLANDGDERERLLMGKALHNKEGFTDEMRHRSRRRRRKIWWTILCYPFKCLFLSEQIGRSFCFGAIDGMLTGAGILSACIGLGLISHLTMAFKASLHTRMLVISLTLAACLADGICMAIGHVWSTRLVGGAAYEERKEELRNFETCRSDAKARLVDALLSQGMLKIDAMSLADTLEGYPDMFVNALLGEGISGHAHGAMGSMLGLGSGGGSGIFGVPGGGGGGGGHRPHAQWAHRNAPPNEWNIPPASYDPREITPGGLKYESYSDFSDFHQDLDRMTLAESVSDSRLEGFFMMISFALFSVIPSLVYTLLPVAMNDLLANGDANILNHDRPP
ncbi:hypothetical protein ACHAXS_013030, partial [Conticribra weissflogii]